MKTSSNGKISYEPVQTERLHRVGIKLGPELMGLITTRALEALKTGRGLNLLFEGKLFFTYGHIQSRRGKEDSFTLYNDGTTKVLPWNPELGYAGSHVFWCEGFAERKGSCNPKDGVRGSQPPIA